MRQRKQKQGLLVAHKTVDVAAILSAKVIETVADRAQSEHALRISEIRYRRLFEAARDGILILDAETAKITDANPYIGELLGYARAELIGKELWQIGLFKDIRESKSAMRELQKNHYIRYEDLPLRAKGQHSIQVEFVSNIYTEGNRSVIQCNIRNITERKHSEVALRESEERYRTLFDLGPVAVYSCTRSGVIEKFNRRAVELWHREPALGDTDELFCGSFKLFRTDGTFMPHPECPMAQVLNGKLSEVRDEEVLIERPDGSRVTVLVNIRPLKNYRGAVIGAINCFYDITERKRAEKKLRVFSETLEHKVIMRTKELAKSQGKDRANLQRLKEVIGTIPMGTIAVDEHDRILHANEALSTIFHMQVSPSELIGMRWEKVFQKIKRGTLHPELYLQQVHDVLKNRQPQSDHEIQMKDGSTILRNYIPIFSKGTHHGHLFLYRDVTRERRIDVSKSDFMSLASHQLRTPLTSIRWAMGRLSKSMGPKVTALERHLLKEGKGAASRMSETIDTMLAIARIESQEVQLNVSQIPLHVFLQNMVKECKESAVKQLSFSLHCPVRLSVQTDCKFLAEILGNLLSNAMKYTPNRGKIALRARKVKNNIVIDIQDSGYGIPIHQQKKIFQKFFRGDNIVGKDTEGTGLGLYLVFLMTNLLGGKISFISKEGKGSGSTFTLSLPIGAGKKIGL